MTLGLYRRRNAFTLVELLVVIGIIALLIGILVPVLSRAWISARRTTCQAGLRDLGMRYRIYLSDNRERLPFVNTMPSLTPALNAFPSIVTVLEGDTPLSPQSYRCPSDKIISNDPGAPAGFDTYFDREKSSYQYNAILGNVPWAGKTIHDFQQDPIGRLQFPEGKLTLLWVLKDYVPFHGKPNTPGAMNYLFWDMRVGDLADEIVATPTP